MNKKKYTDEQLITTVPICKSFSELLEKLGLSLASTNFHRIKKILSKMSIDVSHFDNKWKYNNLILNKPQRQLEEYMKLDGPSVSSNFKSRLYKAGLLKEECYECGQLPIWNGKRLVLQLDHINGNHSDNRLENLRILCGHCHSQTDTFCRGLRKEPNKCLDCKKSILRASKRCQKCSFSKDSIKERLANYPKNKKIEWPDIEILKEKLKTMAWTSLAKELGVSDNAIRRHIWSIDPQYKK